MLETAVQVGLAAAGIALVLRTVAPLSWQIVKPIACDLCMSWWGSLAMTPLALVITQHSRDVLPFIFSLVFTVLAAIPVSMAALKLIERLRAPWEKS